MAASAILANHVRYKDQLKLMRAETAVSWSFAAFDRAIELLKIEPAAIAADDETAKSPRWFGTIY